MSRRAALIGAFFAALAAGTARAAVSTETVTSVVFSTTTGLRTSVALDALNTVHAAYYDSAAQKVMYVTLANGSSAWGTPAVVGDAASVVHSTGAAMVLDATRSPHIVFYDATNHTLKHTKLSGAVWLTDDIETFISTNAFPSIALAGDGSPRVLYNDDESVSTKLASFSGLAWSTYTVFAATMAAPGAIAVDSAGRSHFALNLTTDVFDSASGNFDHDVAYAMETAPGSGVFDGAFFDRAGSTATAAGNISLALDSFGAGHLSYFDEINGDVWYVSGTTDSLSLLGGISAGEVGRSNSIAVDALGQAHIAASTEGGGLNLYTYNPLTTFMSTTTFDAVATAGAGNALILNNYRHALVSYMDAAGSFKFGTEAARGLSLSGTARDAAGAGLPAVTVALSGNIAGASVVTPGAGTYSFANLFEGAYTVTPSFPGYGFLPDHLSFVPLGASLSSQDFLGGAVNFSQLDNLIDPTQGQSVSMTYSFLGGHASIEIYGLNGRLVRTLLNEDKPLGTYAVSWDGRNNGGDVVASGIYLVRVRAGALKKLEKVAVVK